ncbi:MAG TPA: PEP-CTERM sorting domain-containing protein [Candidatus Bathyarchaeia archaeon]|nr:PEP-CTERM sorting domain-containing protein [Candidatus Bathyarchaeia archaeon]
MRSQKLGVAISVAAVLLLIACISADAGTITIGSYDGTVSLRPFTGGDFSNLIADLLDPSNFGPGGINSSSVVIAGAVGSVNASILSGYNVFVMDEVSSLPAGDAAALAAWVAGGGRLVISNDSSGDGATGGNAILSLLDGSSITTGFQGGSTDSGNITASGLSSNGLFGNLVGGTFGASPGSPLIAGASSKIIATSDGANFLMETLAGSGAVLTTADVSFMNFFVPPGTVASNINNGLLFENFMPVLSAGNPSPGPSPVPEPHSLLLLCSGLVGLASATWRRHRHK